MIDQTWVVIIAQLVVTLYLAWKVNRLSNEAEMMQVIVGGVIMDVDGIIMDVEKLEDQLKQVA